MNPYEVLGVSKTAGVAQIRAEYRHLSRKHHPDKGGDPKKFQEIKDAHDILTDPHRRKRFDTTGRTDISPITEERVQAFMDDTMNTVINAVDQRGQTDDPVWHNIKDKLLASVEASRIPLRNIRHDLQRKLERCNRMLERFKPRSEYDPVGVALRKQKEKLEAEMRINQDAFELAAEAERVFKTYDYDVGPGSEGQFNPGPTNRQLPAGYKFLR